MARRRRRSTSGRLGAIVLLVIAAGAAYYWGWYPGRSADESAPPDNRVPLVTDRPESDPADGGPYADVPERGNPPSADENLPAKDVERGLALAASGRRALEQGHLVTARAQLGEALACGLDTEQRVHLRSELVRLARETVFSNKILPDDPFVEAYTIQPGDSLAKIAKRHQVTDDFLAGINDITNKNLIRAGQRIKVVHGPFRVVVTKADYSLDVYLDQTFVKHYPVGLGQDDSTPTGEWRVGVKLKDPTYYPPRGGKIMQPGDPQNPLGERWIGLEGVSGNAVGQQRYGIHGTIEPDSIGRSVSMGCIRMHNADVEELYNLLVEQKSQVTIR